MQDFKIGDFVQFREWDDMVQDFGVNSNGSIKVCCSFTREMKPFCGVVARTADVIHRSGTDAKIVCIDFGEQEFNGYWFSFSTDMIKKINSR